MKKQARQAILFFAVLALLFLWYLWPHSMETRICRDFPAADFSAVEQFSVTWTPENAVEQYAAGDYPRWTLSEADTRAMLDIVREATINRDLPGGSNAMVIYDEGVYDISTWCFHFSLNQNGLLRLWNRNYQLDRRAHTAIWNLLKASNPHMSAEN